MQKNIELCFYIFVLLQTHNVGASITHSCISFCGTPERGLTEQEVGTYLNYLGYIVMLQLNIYWSVWSVLYGSVVMGKSDNVVPQISFWRSRTSAQFTLSLQLCTLWSVRPITMSCRVQARLRQLAWFIKLDTDQFSLPSRKITKLSSKYRLYRH